MVSAGQNMMMPVGIVVADKKTAYVSDSASHRIIQVDIRTGAQKIVSSNGSLTTPFGLALWGDRGLLVGDPDAFDLASGIIQIDLRTGAQSPVTVGSGSSTVTSFTSAISSSSSSLRTSRSARYHVGYTVMW